MTLHDETFNYLQPTAEQIEKIQYLRNGAAIYALCIEKNVPEGPDKTYLLRKLREVAMWANVAITRHADGAPRDRSIDPAVKEYPADHPAPGDLGSVPL